MAKINPSRAYAAKIFTGFEGLGTRKPLSGNGALSMTNFRVKKNGQLESRAGYRQFANFFGDTIRGFWEGTVGGNTYRMVVAGDTAYMLSLDGLTATNLGKLTTSKGLVRFFHYMGDLYLLDGKECRVFYPRSKKFNTFTPYVPLYGFCWTPSGKGDIREPMNLLTNSLRVNYANTAATTFYLPFYAEKIDRVWMDGNFVTDYTLSSDRHYVTIESAKNANVVEIAFTAMFGMEISDSIFSSTSIYTHMGSAGEKLFFSGGKDDHHVFCSATVPSVMLNASRVFYSDSQPLYFKDADVLNIGSLDHPVTAFCPHHGKILAMNQKQAWLIEEDDDDIFTARTILNTVGSPGQYAIAPYKDRIALLGRESLKEITSWLSHPEELKINDLPMPTENFVTESLYQNGILFWNPDEEELWIRDPKDTDGTVWVYKPDSETWYRFDNIPAIFFFRCSAGIGFAGPHGYLYLFEKSSYVDVFDPIVCTYETADFSPKDPAMPMRSLRLSLSGNFGGGSSEIGILCDRKQKTFVIPGGSDKGMEQIDLRFFPGRYRFLRCKIKITAKNRVILSRLACYANP